MKEVAEKFVKWQQEGVLAAVVHELQEDRVVITSTDTVLGLLAPLTENGFVALNRIKARTDKPYLLLIGDRRKLASFVALPLAAPVSALVDQCWPGPLTIVFKAKSGCPSYMQGHDGTIAIRIPAHDGLLQMLQSFDGLFSTSANLSGNPLPVTTKDLAHALVDAVRYVVTEQEDCPSDTPSTILDCTGDAIRVVRKGAYAIEHLEAIARVSFTY